jgi:hypothetical protein
MILLEVREARLDEIAERLQLPLSRARTAVVDDTHRRQREDAPAFETGGAAPVELLGVEEEPLVERTDTRPDQSVSNGSSGRGAGGGESNRLAMPAIVRD